MSSGYEGLPELNSSSDSDNNDENEVLTSNTNQNQFGFGSNRLTGKKPKPDDWEPPPEGSGKDFNSRNAKKK